MLQFTRRIPIDKGWSGDRKYRVTTTEGKDFLLRIFPPEKSGKVRELFAVTQRLAEMGLPICAPVSLEEHTDGTYLLQSWIDGRDAVDVIPQLADEAQYSYGLEAGRILAKLHTLPAPDGREDWETRFNRKIDRKIAAYSSCPVYRWGAISSPSEKGSFFASRLVLMILFSRTQKPGLGISSRILRFSFSMILLLPVQVQPPASGRAAYSMRRNRKNFPGGFRWLSMLPILAENVENSK